jgi:membrane associated rhomboid family serine protease
MTPAIKALILANIVVFVAESVAPSVGLQGFFDLRPRSVFAGFEVWRIVTYMFLHGGLFHILFNMLALWMFGVELERMWGSRYFTKYYFVCGVGGALTMLVLSLVPGLDWMYDVPTLGASGAVYGILLAFALYFPNTPIVLFFVFPVPARYAVMIMGGIALLSSMEASGGIAHGAHLGGLIAGYLYLKGPRVAGTGSRVHPLAELQYRFVKWRINRSRKRFDVYSGGRDGVDRRVH